VIVGATVGVSVGVHGVPVIVDVGEGVVVRFAVAVPVKFKLGAQGSTVGVVEVEFLSMAINVSVGTNVSVTDAVGFTSKMKFARRILLRCAYPLFVAVGVSVLVGGAIGDDVFSGVGVKLGVSEGANVSVGLAVAVSVSVGVVSVATEVSVGVSVSVDVKVGEGVEVGVCAGARGVASFSTAWVRFPLASY